MSQQYISPERLEELKKELELLKGKRHEIASRLEEAKALGDLSENTEYMQAREAQAFNEGKIIETEELVKNAIVIDKTMQRKGIVQIGSKVTLSSGGSEVVYTIVGSDEANPLQGKISNSSPIGQACLNRKKGEEFEVQTPQKKARYKIINID